MRSGVCIGLRGGIEVDVVGFARASTCVIVDDMDGRMAARECPAVFDLSSGAALKLV